MEKIEGPVSKQCPKIIIKVIESLEEIYLIMDNKIHQSSMPKLLILLLIKLAEVMSACLRTLLPSIRARQAITSQRM